MPAPPASMDSDRLAGSIMGPTNTSSAAASCPARRCLPNSYRRSPPMGNSRMDDRPLDSASLLARLEADAIEHFWIAYHDYGGRAQAKTLPRESFRSAVNDGVVFAMANLNMAADDHQSIGATLLADSGDFLAVPDPRSYAVQIGR